MMQNFPIIIANITLISVLLATKTQQLQAFKIAIKN